MSKKTDYLDALESAIRLQHKCRPVHKETVLVHEKTKDDETVWKGDVEVFDLDGHPDAKKCYAWANTGDTSGVKIFAILGNHLIDSANRAVQAAIVMDVQPSTKSMLGIIRTIPSQ